MATNVIPFPMHRVKRNAAITDARNHITHLNAVIPTLDGLALVMAGVMLEYRQAELAGYLNARNDVDAPQRRA